MIGPAFVRDECSEENGGERQRRDDPRVAPAELVRFDESVGDAEEPGGSEPEAAEIEPAHFDRLRLPDGAPSDDETERPDRNVEEEDRLPADVLDHVAADRGPQSEREARDARPDADRLRALVRREGNGDDRERSRHQQRSADALKSAERDQLRRRAGQPAQQRGEGEDREAGEEHPLAPVAVAEDAAGQQQAREREHVPVDDPLQPAHAGAEIARQSRKRHIHDGVVEHRNEERETHRKKDDDLLSIVLPLEHLLHLQHLFRDVNQMRPALAQRFGRIRIAAGDHASHLRQREPDLHHAYQCHQRLPRVDR